MLLVSAPPLLIPEPFSVNELALVMVMPFRSSAAPLAATETAPELAPKAVVWPSLKVPAETVVPPVCALPPDIVIDPLLASIVRAPPPEIAPVILAVKLLVTLKLPSPVKVCTVKFPGEFI